jgi:hypothetical protein
MCFDCEHLEQRADIPCSRAVVITILDKHKPDADGDATLTHRKPAVRTRSSQIDLAQVNERFEKNMAKDK